MNCRDFAGATLAPKFAKMQDCPKWESCSAPICPLDAGWNKRVMHSDDPVCFYLAEAVKEGGAGIFEERGLGELYLAMHSLIQPMSDKWGRIRRTLERAKLSGSRMARPAPQARKP